MERFIYESRPYFFMGLGALALYWSTQLHAGAGKLMLLSGFTLLMAAGYVVHERLRYRGVIT